MMVLQFPQGSSIAAAAAGSGKSLQATHLCFPFEVGNVASINERPFFQGKPRRRQRPTSRRPKILLIKLWNLRKACTTSAEWRATSPSYDRNFSRSTSATAATAASEEETAAAEKTTVVW